MANTYGTTFENHNIFGWTVDDFEVYQEALAQEGNRLDLQEQVREYTENSFDSINALFEGATFKLNLGGATDKNKLKTTDKPMGVFDFSLASRGLYRVSEYYSEKLALEKPNRFIESELPSGVVPANFVNEVVLLGKKHFIFTDDGVDYDCQIRQKGETAIEQNVKGAKLKFATRNRKVYLTYDKKRGKVKYVEIYSLFYYTNLRGDLQFAIRHIPALMVADYFDSIGIKVRFYMTRFVQFDDVLPLQEYYNKNGTQVKLPMYDKSVDRRGYTPSLFIQPFIVKEFGQEMDKAFALMVSSSNYSSVYNEVTRNVLKKESSNLNPPTGGQPYWSQNDYFEGLERYRNKYKEYVDLGIFKSKEVLPEAMVFFHDIIIREKLNDFFRGLSPLLPNIEDSDRLLDLDVNQFFYLWMRTSANVLKHKINIINSEEMIKDIAEIERDLTNTKYEFEDMLTKIQNPNIKTFLTDFGYPLFAKFDVTRNMYGYNIFSANGNILLKSYVTNITDEITTYAEGNIYSTPQENQEFREQILMNCLKALENFK
jgi:hypothetical protein